MRGVDETAAPAPTAADVKAALAKAVGSAVTVQTAVRDQADKLAAERAAAAAPPAEPAPPTVEG